MDAVTAGISLIAVQLCVALIMAAIFRAAREDPCTRHWAQSGTLIGIGVLSVIVNLRFPGIVLRLAGNNAIVAGVVFQWWGLQTFHGRKPGRAGWMLIALFFIAYGIASLLDADMLLRSELLATGTMTGYLFCAHELLRDCARPCSPGRIFAVAAALLLIGGMAARLGASLAGWPLFLPTADSILGVTVVYLVPLVGTLMFSFALLVMYFERVVQSKHYLATHDELTGLLNRRALIAAGEREIKFAQRYRMPLAVAYIDVDHFKAVNDNLGHEHGDSVLLDLAHVLKEVARGTDLVGRYGGEEFCMVCPGLDRAGVAALSERLLGAVRRHPFAAGCPVTISIGFALLGIDKPACNWTELVHDADRALYRAKAGGRDCCRIAGEGDESAAPAGPEPRPEGGLQPGSDAGSCQIDTRFASNVS